MGFYKIRNITDRLPKRHSKKDTPVVITFNDGVTKKTCEIKKGDNFLVKTHNLPISIHKLRAQNLISVVTIDENEFNTEANKKDKPIVTKPKSLNDVNISEDKPITDAPKKTYKRKSKVKKEVIEE